MKNAKLSMLFLNVSMSPACLPTRDITIANTPRGANRIMAFVILRIASLNDVSTLLIVDCWFCLIFVTEMPNSIEKNIIGRMSPEDKTQKMLLGTISTSLSMKVLLPIWVCQLNCVTLDCQELLGDNSERLFLGKLGQGSMPCLSFSTLVA